MCHKWLYVHTHYRSRGYSSCVLYLGTLSVLQSSNIACPLTTFGGLTSLACIHIRNGFLKYLMLVILYFPCTCTLNKAHKVAICSVVEGTLPLCISQNSRLVATPWSCVEAQKLLTIMDQVATALSLQVPHTVLFLSTYSSCQPSVLRHFRKYS